MGTNEMIEMAKEREGWRRDGSSIVGLHTDANTTGFIAEALYHTDALFIARAPRAIIALADEAAALRAEVEALRAERDELKGWLKDKRFATENAWRAYRITQDYCNGAMSAFGEVLERLSE